MAPSSFVTANGVPLDSLRFNQIGVAALRSYLGEGPVYERFKRRFDIADIAWFVAGSHKDAKHQLNPSTFHPDWFIARETSASGVEAKAKARNELKGRLKDLVFDSTTMWDRVTGGATFLVHVDGSVRPGQPLELESVKMDVYIPPHILAELPRTDRVVAELVQKFAEGIGLSAVLRWDRAFKKAGFNRDPDAEAPPPSRTVQPFVPDPDPGTTHYRIYGRPVGEVQDMIEVSMNLRSPGDRDGPARREGLAVPSPKHEDSQPTIPRSPDDDPVLLRRRIAELQALVAEKDSEIARLQGEMKDFQDYFLECLPPVPSPSWTPSPSPSPTSGHPALLTPLSPRPVQPAEPPRPTTPQRAETPQFAGSAFGSPVTTRSSKRKGKAPETRSSKASASSVSSVSSLSTRLSSVSMSDWASVRPVTPTPSHSHSPAHLSAWDMPSPLTVRSPRPEGNAPSTPGPLVRFKMVGEHTDEVLRQAGLPPRAHRELCEVVRHIPEEMWDSGVQAAFPQLARHAVSALVAAMRLDVPEAD
ncbi:hypothetical protein OH77DRAFT_503134 [Trametes cingulata]|nr:hypothetical protein OH77DRAFT_503134 [Trametes cingulata]